MWDPVENLRNKQVLGDLRRDIVTGALGAGPRPDVMNKITLGAAVVSVAVARSQAATAKEPVHVAELAARLLPDVIGHAAGLFTQQLKIGMESFKRLLDAAASAQRRYKADLINGLNQKQVLLAHLPLHHQPFVAEEADERGIIPGRARQSGWQALRCMPWWELATRLPDDFKTPAATPSSLNL